MRIPNFLRFEIFDFFRTEKIYDFKKILNPKNFHFLYILNQIEKSFSFFENFRGGEPTKPENDPFLVQKSYRKSIFFKFYDFFKFFGMQKFLGFSKIRNFPFPIHFEQLCEITPQKWEKLSHKGEEGFWRSQIFLGPKEFTILEKS